MPPVKKNFKPAPKKTPRKATSAASKSSFFDWSQWRQRKELLAGVVLVGAGALAYFSGATGMMASVFDDIGFEIFDVFEEGAQTVDEYDESGLVEKTKAIRNVEMHVLRPKDAAFFGYDTDTLTTYPPTPRDEIFQFQNYQTYDFELLVLSNGWDPYGGSLVQVKNPEDNSVLFKGITDEAGKLYLRNVSLPIHHKTLLVQAAIEEDSNIMIGESSFPVRIQQKTMSVIMRVFPHKTLE